jgi:hypothetical protein
MKENYLDEQIPLTNNDIIEEIINNNYFLIEAIRSGNKEEVLKRKILIDNLIKIYLK